MEGEVAATEQDRVAELEAEVAQLRKALADLAASHRAHADREQAERERKEARRRVNRQNYERRKGKDTVQTSESDRIQTLNNPSPPLDGSPLPSAPSLPSPLSSPHPLSAASDEPRAETGNPERVPFALLPAEPDRPPEPKPRPEKPKGLPPEALQEAWNRVAVPLGYQRWEAMSPTRSKAARLALEACPDVARWEAWLAHELARPFNRGDNGSGWKADVDWLLRAKTRDMVRDFNPATAPKTSTPTKPTAFKVL